MQNIAFMTKFYGLSYAEIMELPYPIFLSYLKWARIFIMQQTKEGQEELQKMQVLKGKDNTEPDLGRIRALTGYKEVD